MGLRRYRRDTIIDTTVQIVIFSKESGRNDTNYIQKKYLSDYMKDSNFIHSLGEEVVQRVELVEYYKTFIPDSTTFICPLTKKPYIINIDNENNTFTVTSPISRENPYRENRFYVFSLKSNGHGEISDGNRSWD